ncbi:UNVERIFIED_CONTAM: hypothetical protein Sangu_2235100 [Sesamum angustifolium]|uniref:Zinc knuckle CX2CX4HX4C domain-containing protein n=1 Tax=Sesamum angustifolium TaxID=2727405 RepID=A0AAW2L3P0_9LAMI
MDSLTMKMERVSYAYILVKVDASKTLVDQVEFILSNGVTRKQLVVYEFIPKFCMECNRFVHLKDSCQGTQPSTTAATTTPAANIKSVAPNKVQSIEWTVVQCQHKNNQKHQHPTMGVQQPDISTVNNNEQGRPGTSKPQPTITAVVQNMPPQ